MVLLGGPDVGPATLLNFYALHISFIPIAMFLIASYHFWRIRKDGFSIPRSPGEEPITRPDKSLTFSQLVRPEAAWATVTMAALVVWSMVVQAPLEAMANPDLSPNPAKAPWYFMGLQELLLHFHPLVGGIFLPGLALIAMAAMAYVRVHGDHAGIYFYSRRGRWLSLASAFIGMVSTFVYVVLDEFILDWARLMPRLPSLVSTGVVPLALLLLGIMGYYELVRRGLGASRGEAILATFVLLLAGFAALTVIGIFFRGAGMALILPWDATLH
jgi:quinol-cytochrome oxidoreductase complex cytochrome b subunit